MLCLIFRWEPDQTLTWAILMKKLVIRKKDVARLLDISESTVVRWSKNGRLPPPFSIGPNRTVWLHSEIVSFVEMMQTNRGFNSDAGPCDVNKTQ